MAGSLTWEAVVAEVGWLADKVSDAGAVLAWSVAAIADTESAVEGGRRHMGKCMWTALSEQKQAGDCSLVDLVWGKG